MTVSDSDTTAGTTLSIVVVGASGDLAKKKIFPALFALYYENCLPEVTNLDYLFPQMFVHCSILTTRTLLVFSILQYLVIPGVK